MKERSYSHKDFDALLSTPVTVHGINVRQMLRGAVLRDEETRDFTLTLAAHLVIRDVIRFANASVKAEVVLTHMPVCVCHVR